MWYAYFNLEIFSIICCPFAKERNLTQSNNKKWKKKYKWNLILCWPLSFSLYSRGNTFLSARSGWYNFILETRMIFCVLQRYLFKSSYKRTCVRVNFFEFMDLSTFQEYRRSEIAERIPCQLHAYIWRKILRSSQGILHVFYIKYCAAFHCSILIMQLR